MMDPKIAQQRKLGAKILVFLPIQKDAILSRHKTHTLIPFTAEDVIQTGRRLVLEAYLSYETNVTAVFAEAEAGDVHMLRIDPKTESIYQLRPGSFSHIWQKLTNDLVNAVAKKDGYTHKDNFWQAMHNRVLPGKQTVEVLQVEIKYLVPILSVTP